MVNLKFIACPISEKGRLKRSFQLSKANLENQSCDFILMHMSHLPVVFDRTRKHSTWKALRRKDIWMITHTVNVDRDACNLHREWLMKWHFDWIAWWWLSTGFSFFVADHEVYPNKPSLRSASARLSWCLGMQWICCILGRQRHVFGQPGYHTWKWRFPNMSSCARTASLHWRNGIWWLNHFM